MKTLNDYATECHKANEQWWRDIETGEPLERNVGEMLMLTVTELAESMEGARKDLMDDHLPHRKMAEVEMADTFIRLMDFCGGMKIDIPTPLGWEEHSLDLSEMVSVITPPVKVGNVGESLMRVVIAVGDMYRHNDSLKEAGGGGFRDRARTAVFEVMRHCSEFGYDLQGAYADKMAYNAQRADHKAENRRKQGGKKF